MALKTVSEALFFINFEYKMSARIWYVYIKYYIPVVSVAVFEAAIYQ